MNNKTKQAIIQGLLAGDSVADIANKNKISDKTLKNFLSEVSGILNNILEITQEKKSTNPTEIAKNALILEVKAELMNKGYTAEVADTMISNVSNITIDEHTSVEMLMTAVLLKAKKADLLNNKKGVTIMTSGISQVIDTPKTARPKKKRDDGVFKL